MSSARGLSVVVIERHGQVGGCAGFFTKKGFAFDVGATTLVDFEKGGVGGELLEEIGLDVELEALPGYEAWLPDRNVTLHRDGPIWAAERAKKLGDSPAHRRLFGLLDRLADVFWGASRRGVTLPMRSLGDVLRAARAVPVRDWPLAIHLRRSLGDAIRACGLAEDTALRGLFGMLVEDTVHASVDDAPLINAALGITIRGAGLSRARGGMRGFFRALASRYRALGGVLRVGTTVRRVSGSLGDYAIETSRDEIRARQVVSALPLEVVAKIAPEPLARDVRRALERNAGHLGGALVLFASVPEAVVAGRWTHHQILESYDAPLGNGNNLFISLSSPGDVESAPQGFRSVMISTHCELEPWQGLDEASYRQAKEEAAVRLLGLASRAFPDLPERATVVGLGTPITYERYTGRPLGAVGGFRQWRGNANQNAVGHETALAGFHLAGDGTWPGLGTVAACLASRKVAENVGRAHAGSRAKARNQWSITKPSGIVPSA